MAEFTHSNMANSRFEDVTLARSEFKNVDLTGIRIRGALFVDIDISAEIDNVRINGVDVVPLIGAELDRRYPERVKLRPTTVDGFREAWTVIEDLWTPTVERARRLAPEQLHKRVNGEWSFIETLRHLVFATDSWVKRTILGDSAPYDPLDLPHDEMDDEPGVPRDLDARPTLDEVLALRTDRMAVVRDVIDGLTDAALASKTDPVPLPGYPVSDSYSLRECLQVILDEEWAHRMYAERDFDALEATS